LLSQAGAANNGVIDSALLAKLGLEGLGLEAMSQAQTDAKKAEDAISKAKAKAKSPNGSKKKAEDAISKGKAKSPNGSSLNLIPNMNKWY
jgi:hypothetical protein